MKCKQLRTVLKTYSPDALHQGLPLLYWALKKPECVALLLNHGANPDISCLINEELQVSPLYAVQYGLRASKRRVKSELVRELLELYGASAIRYSDFCVVEIQQSTNELIL